MKLDKVIKIFCLDYLDKNMLITIKLQVNVLLCSVLAGIILGILYDLFKMINDILTDNRILNFFENILFGIVSSFIVFIFLLKTNSAYFETYTYLYITLGIYCYIKLIRRYFIEIQKTIIVNVNFIFRTIYKLFMYPFELIYYFIIKNRRNKKK